MIRLRMQKMCHFNNNTFRARSHRSAFTLVEVGAALVLLSMILSSVMVLMNRYVDAVIDLQLRQEAFELARGNMEQLLAETKLSDMAEFGDSEQNPEIEWQTLVEPFYEPVTDQMWIRAVCSAGFDDTKGEYQNIELEHWITNLTAAQVKRGAAVSFGSAFLLGIYLAAVGGWPIVTLGLASLAAGYAYTGGSKPIAYSASGELFVFLFFGVFAVTGSHYLQTLTLSGAAATAGAALGLLAAAVLTVNNYRDLDSDRRAGRLTLCHWLGRERARWLYALLLLAPFLLILHPATAPWPLLPALPFALLLVYRFYREPPGVGLNRLLAATARFQLAFGLLLSFGYLT